MSGQPEGWMMAGWSRMTGGWLFASQASVLRMTAHLPAGLIGFFYMGEARFQRAARKGNLQ